MHTANTAYRVAETSDLKIGNRVYCYYITPRPTEQSLGTVTSDPSDPYCEGWVYVDTDDGKRHCFNSDRLAVLR